MVVYKEELVAAIAEEAGIMKKDANNALNAFANIVERSLRAGKCVQITAFGTFSTRKSASRIARNIKTGEEIVIPEKKRVVFKPGKQLKGI